MIKNIFIKNFILIEEVTLDFEEGFSAFTGETGAGKSVLIDAISLLRADRASASFVMQGKEKAIIEGTFDLSDDSHALHVLEENGFDPEEYYTFSREIYANGKSIARLNHRVISLSLMKEILMNEIDIHGQRDNAYLLQSQNHILLLDRYLHLEEKVQKVSEAYAEYRKLQQQKEKALQETYNENDLEYFRYQIQEILSADLKPQEDEELEAREKTYRSLRDSMEKLNTIDSLYSQSVSENLYQIKKSMDSLKDFDGLDTLQEQFNDAYYSLTDAIESLLQKKEEMSLTEEEINAMEERLFTIQKLKRKYGPTIEDILNFRKELEKKVESFDHRKESLDSLDREIEEKKQRYRKLAEELHTLREKGAPKLDKAILSQLKELKLENAQFKTEIQPSSETRLGMDAVEFKVAMNRGQHFSSLSLTASGGELSRLMLGLKVIFTHIQGIHTVIFDEIDTGVSGIVAGSIGKKMAQLSRDCQVFSVTHLAPVAAWASHQYLVAKHARKNTTQTTITELNTEQRIEQLAILASGEITEASKMAARELLSRSHL